MPNTETLRREAVSEVDLERMEEGYDDFILQERSLRELNPTFPGNFYTGKKIPLNFDDLVNSFAFPPLPPHLKPSIKEQALKGKMIVSEDLSTQIQQESEEIELLFKAQGEQVSQLLEEKRQRHSRALLAAIEEGISRRFRDKDLEMENMKRQNLELAEHVKQLSIKAHNWQAKARTNEAMVTALKSNLQQAQQAVALSLEQSKEGCGDSEADDAASSHHGDDDAHARTFKENRELREQRTCRMKGKNQNQETSSFESPSYPRLAFGPDFPCTTDGHLKQENQFSTVGISDTTQNCFQTGLQEILTMGRKGRFEGADSIEFLFEQAEDMSKVVGVGLQWSKVVVTKQFGVVVEHIGEHLWSDLWKETSFSPMRIPILKPPSELSMCNLTPEQSSKSFGVGLVGSRLENNCVYVEDNQNQTGEMFPFIFELAEKMGLSAKDSNFQHPSGISSEAVEGEKNCHGGSLLETMEGGGETDQGGTSSEPMDPMEVGESSQGGNLGEPMEGVESGQGDPSSGPTEVGGQRDQQSSDFQLRCESLQAKGPQDSNENKSLTVIVIPEVGGTFYEGLSNRQVQPDCRIKGAAIAPWLKFKFEILGGERKITTTTETRCDLGGGQLTLHEDWDLGYCHDNITISLTCLDPQAVRVSPGTVVAIDVMKRAMTETFTGSMSRANQIASQANVQVQMPVVPIGIQAQGTLEVTDTIADSHALAVTVETSNTQFAGFNVNQLECAGSLVLNFLYPEEIVDVKARGKRQFIHAGINKTLWPTIVGKWLPLDREEARLYIFKTDRDIYSIGSLMRLHANMNNPMFMQQRYEVPFVINHAMSHIHYYEDKELRGPGVKSVDRVLTKYPEI